MKQLKPSSDTEEFELELAKKRVNEIKNFYTHLFIYVVGVLIFICKTYFGAPFNFWPIRHINCFFMWAWTFIIAVQGLRLFLKEKMFSSKWEQKKINEFVKKDKHNKWE